MSELRVVNHADELDYSKLVDPQSEIGIVPVVCIDGDRLRDDGLRAYRMQAFASRMAVAITLDTGRATFWSRNQQKLWTKGSDSGNILVVRGIYTDCDRDSLLLDIRPEGPTCHTGAESCFEIPRPTAEFCNNKL